VSKDKLPPAIPAALLITEYLRDNYYLARTESGEPFAVRCDVPSVMIPLRGKNGLRQRLAAEIYRDHNRVMSGEAMAAALNLAEGIALNRPKPIMPMLRVAAEDGVIYLDLGRPDGLTAAIHPGWWTLTTHPPVLFMRSAITGELPVPAEPGAGSLDEVRDLLNIADPDHWALYIACRIASLFPGITHPIETITGPAGSTKTTVTRLTANWIDPSITMTPVPRDGRTWASYCASRYCQPVDNVSYILAWWSDLLCKSASGDGWMDRALYTDGEIFAAQFRNVIILNGIELGALRGDLADRTARHVLAVPALRRSDDELADIWRREHPPALGWLLDRTAEIYGDTEREGKPAGPDRLVRFGQILRLCDKRWFTNGTAAFAEGRQDTMEDVAEGDAVSVAIMTMVTPGSGAFEGTISDLLRALTNYGGLRDPERGGRWTPHLLGGRLARSESALQNIGWQVDHWRVHGGVRMLRIIPPSPNGQHPS
jgi:hypothetical protein